MLSYMPLISEFNQSHNLLLLTASHHISSSHLFTPVPFYSSISSLTILVLSPRLPLILANLTLFKSPSHLTINTEAEPDSIE